MYHYLYGYWARNFQRYHFSFRLQSESPRNNRAQHKRYVLIPTSGLYSSLTIIAIKYGVISAPALFADHTGIAGGNDLGHILTSDSGCIHAMSFYTISFFPDKSYGYLNCEPEIADGIRKLNGSLFWGVRVGASDA